MKYFLLFFAIFTSYLANATTWKIGTNETYTKPSQVANLVGTGDTVLIQSGSWKDDVANWRKDNLLIKGIDGMVTLDAGTSNSGGKAIWVIPGSNVTVENIEFLNCKVPDKNGAGIRYEGKKLTAINCKFHHNEMGILTANDPETEIYFYGCEFYQNGYGDGYSHNIYIGRCKKFVMKYCYSHQGKVGHCVKSRASENYIMYNRITDLEDGYSSMLIDLPNGGKSYIIGNEMMEGPLSENRNIISYGMEDNLHSKNYLCLINNTIVSKRSVCSFIKAKTDTIDFIIKNNIFVGPGVINDGFNADTSQNYYNADIKLVKLKNVDLYDYSLLKGSPAINQGIILGKYDGTYLSADEEYIHPFNSISRNIDKIIDYGAHEFVEFTSVEELTNQTYDSIEIYDILGNLILSDSNFQLDNLNNFLQKGIYIIKLNTNNSIKFKKIII